ncbi:unnamed protein product [Ophioblennius macclurei]
MPVPAMADLAPNHQRRFQAAVDVIHNLPKNGSYRPSYEVMLRFYSLYKQALCGPCSASRPGFWDPVGRYKWDAWSRLGEMSSESAMEAYVDEMKKVAQEVIDTMPMDEKTASLFTHFEPLYHVIHDMPRPPEELLRIREMKVAADQDLIKTPVGPSVEQEVTPCGHVTSSSPTADPRVSGGVAEGVALTSDSESEVFCDSLERLGEAELPEINGIRLEGRHVGAGHGGEGAEDGRGHGPHRRGRNLDRGREAPPPHGGREGGIPQGGAGQRHLGGGAGRGGGDRGAEPQQDALLQQQIVLALRRLREDMRSVMERLEAVETLAAAQAQSAECQRCEQCAAPHEDRWWSVGVSSSTFLLLFLWPFAAQALVFLLKRLQRKRGGASP